MMEPNFKAGDELTHGVMNDLVRDQALDVRASGGVSVRSSGSRQLTITHRFTGAFCGVVATGGISVRSGATLGNGPVELWVKDPSTGVYVDSGIAITADCISSFTGGIPATCWCSGFYQDDGTPLIMTVDYGA